MMDPVLNSGMCRCCASEGTFKNVMSKYHWMGDEEIYADMLRECFDITLCSSDGGLQSGICEVCITQLRNAANFKKQVQQTEEQFKKRLQDNMFKANIVKLEMGTVEDDDGNLSDNNLSEDFVAEFEVPIKKESEEPKSKKRGSTRASTSRAKKPKLEDGESSAKNRNMNSKAYRWCAVPLCPNTSIKTPEKLFIFVPFDKTIRNKWLKHARRDLKGITPSTQLYFCEDHFDLPSDMENYMEYHVMGSVSQIRMKKGCVPLKFYCQPDRRKRASDSMEREYFVKKQRKELIGEFKPEQISKNTTIAIEQSELIDFLPGTSSKQENITQDAPKTTDKAIQVYITNKFRSKAVQTIVNSVDQMTSPSKPFCQSAFTSPFKIRKTKTDRPSTSSLQKCIKKLIEIQADSDSDISYTPSVVLSESPSVTSLKIKSSSDCSELVEDDKKQEALRILGYTVQKIVNNPQSYIGVPKSCYYLINLIEKKLNITINHILMCLQKNKLN